MVEKCVKGKWRTFPTLVANGQVIVVRGSWIKTAALDDEDLSEREVENPQACIERIQNQRHVVPADIFSFSQKLPLIAQRFNYPMELESIAVAHTANFENWWQGLPQESRKNVRRAQKRGVLIGLEEFNDELIRGIQGVQNETPIRQGKRYPHYGKTVEEVKRLHAVFADRSDFIVARCEGQFIGFLKLVYCGDVASIFQLNSMLAHYDKRPSNALVAKAVELCSAKGIEYLKYGRFNYGNKSDSSLREFKIRNGFEEVLVPRYYVPLTPWGTLCVRFKLYRGLLGILPQSVILSILTVRRGWYHLRKL